MPVFKGEGKVSRLWLSHVVWLTCFYKHVCLLILLKAWVLEQRNCGSSKRDGGRQKYVMEAWKSFKLDLSLEMWHETAPFHISIPGWSSSLPITLGTTPLMLQCFAAAAAWLSMSCTEPVDHSWAEPRSCLCPLVAQFPLPGIAVPGVPVGSLPGSPLHLFSPCLWQREPLTSRVGGVIWLKIILW